MRIERAGRDPRYRAQPPSVSRVEGSSSQVSPVCPGGELLNEPLPLSIPLPAERRMTERDSHRVVLRNIRIIMEVLGKLLRSSVSQYTANYWR